MSKPWMPHVAQARTRRDLSLEWRAAPALRGDGTILVARHKYGLQVLAPPGVRLTSRHATGDADDDQAWRWGLWVADVNGDLWLEQMHPAEVRELSLQEVVDLLPPSRFAWVHERCRRRVLSLVGYVTPSATGTVPQDAAVAWHRMEGLVEDLEAVFPDGDWQALVPSLSNRLEVPDTLPPAPKGPLPPRRRPPLVHAEPADENGDGGN